jgi:hypothetical protein
MHRPMNVIELRNMQVEHDVDIKLTSRNEVLDKLKKMIEDECKPLRKKPLKNNTEMAYDRVLKMIESLR